MEFKIPPLPTTLGEILQILSREASVPDDSRLVQIIEKDPAISIYVLRQVNSSYYGLRRHITEIRRAVAMLGLKRVCNLVLAASLKQTFAYLEEAQSQTIYEHVIKTSVATAAFARDLAAYLHLPLAETAFTAGLLHQLGRLVFLYSAPHLYVPLWYNGSASANSQKLVAPSRDTEYVRFNTDYLRLGASTLRQWHLPEEFAIITNRLDTPDEISQGPLRTLTLTVAAGTAASEALLEHDPPATEETVQNVSSHLLTLAQMKNIDAEDLVHFLDERGEPIAEFAHSVINDL